MIHHTQLQQKPFVRKQVTLVKELFARYHSPDFLGMDPLITLQRFSTSKDLEIAALVAAVLAYGRVETIIKDVENIFERMEYTPFSFITKTGFKDKKHQFKTFRHRFTNGMHMALLLEAVSELIRTYGSIELCFLYALNRSSEKADMAAGIHFFSSEIKKQSLRIGRRNTLPEYFGFCVPTPYNGSACKRMNMYLRWMVRPADGIDFGIWKCIDPSYLYFPVDTHIARIAQVMHITRRKTADWRMVEEITRWFRTIDEDDPVRFDFSLCRSGMVALRRSAA